MTQKNALRIAMVGTRGVPARYGGFETCVEEVGRRLVERGHEVTVYCRSTDGPVSDAETYLGMRLVHRPALRRRSLETLSHTGLSVAHQVRYRSDVAIVFNAANAPWLPLLRRAKIPVATHVDGLEWQRDKWGAVGKRYYLMAEKLAVRWSDALIADAPGIAQYYLDRYRAETVQIAYGAPIVRDDLDRLDEVGLEGRGFHLVVARFEPENHVEEIVRGYSSSSAVRPLIVVGSAPYADEYTRRVHEAADERVRFLGGLWDQELLNQLYAGSLTYLHGQSVGGTNPSLLRAIGAGAAVNAFDVVFNRDVLQGSGRFFTTPEDVARLVETAEDQPSLAEQRGRAARERAADFTWDDVTQSYEDLCLRLSLGRPRQSNVRAH